MKKTVTFPFAPNDKVRTVTGSEGVIDTCAVDVEEGFMFLVMIGDKKSWYYTSQLTLVAETKDESQDSEG